MTAAEPRIEDELNQDELGSRSERFHISKTCGNPPSFICRLLKYILAASTLTDIPDTFFARSYHDPPKPSAPNMNASVNTTVANFVRAAVDQAHGKYDNLTLIPFNATLGFIAIDPSATRVDILSPAIGDLFAEGVFSIPQACAYPISGTGGGSTILSDR